MEGGMWNAKRKRREKCKTKRRRQGDEGDEGDEGDKKGAVTVPFCGGEE